MVSTEGGKAHNSEAPTKFLKDRAQNDQEKDFNDLVFVQDGSKAGPPQAGNINEQNDGVTSYSEPLQTKQDIGSGNEESEEARIERLGRERPAKFKSVGAELAFCYAILASQFMAVCHASKIPTPIADLTTNRNTSSPASTSFFLP